MGTQPHATLQKGFADPVDGAGQTFRNILDAMSHPGKIVEITRPTETPEGLSGAAAAVLLSLADYATPVWFDDALSTEAIISYVRFHTSAPLQTEPSKAMFAMLRPDDRDIPLSMFNTGTPEYPDRSTTLIIDVPGFEDGPTLTLSGPGIDGTASLQVAGLKPEFWHAMQDNNAQFPLGVDVMFTSECQLAALPRSTRIEVT